MIHLKARLGDYAKNSQRKVPDGITMLLKVFIVTLIWLKPIGLVCPRLFEGIRYEEEAY